MRSTILLLNTCRRRLWVCLFIEVVISFVSGMDESHIRLVGANDAISLPFVFAACLSLWACSTTRFNVLPFPANVHQRAWLPILGFLLLWAAGQGAVLAAYLCANSGLSNIIDFFFFALSLFPLYFLGYLLVFRFVRTKPHFIGFIWMGMLFTHPNASSWFAPFLNTYHLWWPLVIAGIAFYLYEAPIMIAHRDRLLAGQSNNQLHFVRIPDVQIAWRSHVAICIAETVEAVFLFVAILMIFKLGYSLFFLNSGLFAQIGTWGPVVVPSLLFMLFLVLIFISLCKGQYYFTTASGFSPASALGMTVMEMTLILNPLAQAMGVKKGVIAICDQCHMKKFLWAPHCPHCGNPGCGAAADKRIARVVEGKSPVVQWKLRIFRGVFIPLQFFIMFGLMGAVGQRAFVTHGETLSFRDQEDTESHARAITRIKELIAEHPDPVVWLGATSLPEDSAFHVPEKFRVVVEVLGDYNIKVSGYGLRWDVAQALTTAVALRLSEEVEGINPPDANRQSIYSHSSPLFQTRTYLDNQMHWVEPKE